MDLNCGFQNGRSSSLWLQNFQACSWCVEPLRVWLSHQGAVLLNTYFVEDSKGEGTIVRG